MSETSQTALDQQPKLTFLSLVLRTLSGLGGGILGTFILIVFYLFTQSLFGGFFQADPAETNPLEYFMLIAMVFTSSLGANLLAPYLLSIATKAERITTILTQILIVNILILIICLPLYLFAFSIDFTSGSYIAGLQVIFSILASALILNMFSASRYGLVWVYGTLLGSLLAIGLSVVMFLVSGSVNVLLFIAYPLFWGGIAFIQSIFMMLYRWLATISNSDFLALSKKYGKDYGKSDEEFEEEEEKEPEDIQGGEFLGEDTTETSEETTTEEDDRDEV